MSSPAPARPRARRDLVSPHEAAARLNISPRTVRRYIAAGRLNAYRVGPRLLKVDLAELDAMLRPIPTAGGTDG